MSVSNRSHIEFDFDGKAHGWNCVSEEGGRGESRWNDLRLEDVNLKGTNSRDTRIFELFYRATTTRQHVVQ